MATVLDEFIKSNLVVETIKTYADIDLQNLTKISLKDKDTFLTKFSTNYSGTYSGTTTSTAVKKNIEDVILNYIAAKTLLQDVYVYNPSIDDTQCKVSTNTKCRKWYTVGLQLAAAPPKDPKIAVALLEAIAKCIYHLLKAYNNLLNPQPQQPARPPQGPPEIEEEQEQPGGGRLTKKSSSRTGGSLQQVYNAQGLITDLAATNDQISGTSNAPPAFSAGHTTEAISFDMLSESMLNALTPKLSTAGGARYPSKKAPKKSKH